MGAKLVAVAGRSSPSVVVRRRASTVRMPRTNLEGRRGNGGHLLALAEREGFEPSVRLPVHMISNHAPSTTRSSLLGQPAPGDARPNVRSERRRRARSAAFLNRPRHARKVPWKGRGGQPPTDAGRADAPVFGAGERAGRDGRVGRDVRRAPREALCGGRNGRKSRTARTLRAAGTSRTARTQGASGGPRGSREGPGAVRADAPAFRRRGEERRTRAEGTGRMVSSERLGRKVRQAVPAKREGPYAVRADAPTRRERDSLGLRRLRRLSLVASVRIGAGPQLAVPRGGTVGRRLSRTATPSASCPPGLRADSCGSAANLATRLQVGPTARTLHSAARCST